MKKLFFSLLITLGAIYGSVEKYWGWGFVS